MTRKGQYGSPPPVLKPSPAGGDDVPFPTLSRRRSFG